MMREILFRGKRLDNGEWVDGFLVRTTLGSTIIVSEVEEYSCGCCLGIGSANFEVNPSTVGQYTGLTDKNGKRIFEGDMVSTDIERPYLIVEFRGGCFMFNCNDGGEDYYDIMLPILKDPQSVYKYGEVIGNIHDNSERLEASEND